MLPEDFIAALADAGIPAVDYPPEELDDDVQVAPWSSRTPSLSSPSGP